MSLERRIRTIRAERAEANVEQLTWQKRKLHTRLEQAKSLLARDR
jgi:hypothetical protein